MKTKYLIFLFSLGLCWLPVSLIATSVVWVAPNGNDDADGSQERPVATLARAKIVLRERIQKGLPRDAAIRFREGIYRLSEPVEFTPEDLGDGQYSVTFSGVPGEKVVLSGARLLPAAWKRMNNSLWILEIPEARAGNWVFRSLFRSGESLPRAREPDEGYYTVAQISEERRRLDIQEDLPEDWSGLTGVELNTIAHWHFNRQPVAEISRNSVLARRGIGTDVSSSRITETSHSRVWLENALAFADQPGEWFLDSIKGALYLRVAPGEDPNQNIFSAPILRELIIIKGTSERLVRGVRFQNMEFAETDWEMPEEGRLGVQAGAWAVDRSRTFSPGAALRFLYAHDTAVENCAFRDLGEGAVSYEIGTRNGRVDRCHFLRVGSNAVQVGRISDYTGAKHPLHRDFSTLGGWVERQEKLPNSDEMWQHTSTTVREAPAQIVIADNSFIDCGRVDFGSVAVSVTYAHHVTIEHNLIRNLPYSAISVGWRWAAGFTNCHSNLIRRNRIEHIMQQAGDGGGIYLVGEQPGTRVLENYIHDVGQNYWAHGIYPDENSNHMEIAGNYVTAAMDHSIFMNRNGPDQLLHDNNGESGLTTIRGEASGRRWVKFLPERTPLDLSLYGPRARLP